MRMRGAGLSLIALLACGHDDPFSYSSPSLGPLTTGADVLLTYNGEQDYWPTWTEDRSAILYGFVDSTVSGQSYDHRCIGLMRPAGGTRLWQYCDNRAALADSFSSFPAFALGNNGRLLYAEGAIDKRRTFLAGNVNIWLADTAHPFRRRLMVALPVTVGDSLIEWVGDLKWTGPETFVGLGQRFNARPRP